MLHIVEIRHIGTDRDDAADELRRWLSEQSLRPVLFEHSTGGPGVTFRVHFRDAHEAEACAKTFSGWLNNSTARPGGARHWALQASPAPRD